jgi:hypothetical protein
VVGRFGAQEFDDFVQRPDVEFALDALAVGVGGRVVGAVRLLHFADDVVEGFTRYARVLGLARGLICFEVHARELSIVVQHFFEVRHQPAVVGRIASEAASEVVVHAPVLHTVEGAGDHLE